MRKDRVVGVQPMARHAHRRRGALQLLLRFATRFGRGQQAGQQESPLWLSKNVLSEKREHRLSLRWNIRHVYGAE